MADTTMLGEDATLLVLPETSAAASSAITHSLLVTEQAGTRRRLTVRERPLTIGRAAPSDLLIDSGLVSRQHCRFHLEGEQVFVTDLGSTNGTLVDGARITGSVALQHGAVLQIGRTSIIYECRSRRELDGAVASDRDIQGASAYVQMLLPKPLQGGPVRANWLFLPSAELGGNAFGYRFLTDSLFSGFMVDVAGQGTEAAMHSVAVMNLLRQQSVPGIDLADPTSVLGGLNTTFRQEEHNGMFFLMCYFVLDLRTRRLRYGSAGRHPGYLVPSERGGTTTLTAEGPPIGLSPAHVFATSEVEVPESAMLYLLSDGASESLSQSASYARPGCIEALIRAPVVPGMPEPLRLYNALRDATPADSPDEDLSVLVFAF